MTRINTKSHNHARQSLGRLIRSYQKGEIDTESYKGIVYGMNLLLGYYKLEIESDFERRLIQIEDEIEAAKAARKRT